MAVVTLNDVSKTYPLGKREVKAVRGVSCSIEEGDFVSFVGPSGSGKTTTLNLIGCIDVPTSGEVLIEDTDTASLNDNRLTELRHRTLGFIFQSFNLVPVLNVYENVEFPLLLGKTRKEGKAERRDRINALIEGVGLGDQIDQKPSELSGGQMQRVAIARALVTEPKVVLADEPTANLDSETSQRVLSLMRELSHTRGVTFIFSTHDPEIMQMADHTLRLHDGAIVEEKRSS